MNRDFSFTYCLSYVGCLVSFLVINLLFGAWSVNVILLAIFAKTIPLWGAMLIGAFAGEITIPVAVIIAILKYFHVL